MVAVKFLRLYMLFVICKWQATCEKEVEHDWFHYQKLHAIQIGLIQSKSLEKYMNSSVLSINDNRVFMDDKMKVKRSYDTRQCLRDLGKIRKAFSDDKDNWATESRRFFVLKIMIFFLTN